jgi:hypothetical protein
MRCRVPICGTDQLVDHGGGQSSSVDDGNGLDLARLSGVYKAATPTRVLGGNVANPSLAGARTRPSWTRGISSGVRPVLSVVSSTTSLDGIARLGVGGGDVEVTLFCLRRPALMTHS